tara:strand:+ start:1150864 stop:1153071 length:2208 start_codon:yes stop_codon:yes gene_type:complete
LDALTVDSLITDSPVAIALLDEDCRFQNYSTVWLHQFCPDHTDIEGKFFFDIMPNLPLDLNDVLPLALEGQSSEHTGKKFLSDNGAFKWLKWKVNPKKNSAGEIDGLIVVLEDVTEQRKKEVIHQRALEVARIGGWEIDLLTNDLFWTDITKEIHEVPLDYVPKLEEGINFYKEGRHRNTINKVVDRAITTGTPWDVKLVIVTAKGREKWVRAMGDVEMRDGKCVRIFGTFQDIDDEKKMELKLNEVSNRLAIATTGSKIGIWEYDLTTENIVWDDNMYALYGVKRKKFNPNNTEDWASIMTPEDMEALSKTHAAALEGEKDYNTKFRVRWPDGQVKHIGARAVILKNSKGKPIKMIGTNLDITELTQTQMMLEKSEESFHEAFERSNTGMALVGIEGNWIRVNKRLCEKLGYSQEELLKTTFQDITHVDDLDKDLQLLYEVIDGKRDSYRIEKRYLHKKGHTVYAILTVTAVRNIDGDLSHFVSQIMDITHRIRAEKELTRLLEVTKNQNDSLLNFAHIVSHNLRSHATNLSMLTGFLAGEKDEAEVTEIHSMLKDASESLNETVIHLNDVVQLKVGASEKMVPVNLYDTLFTVKKNLSVLFQEKDVTCQVDMPKNLNIMGIPAYVDSIFLNLLTNGIKYSSPDRAPLLKISSEITDKNVILSFEDNGLGINLKRHGKKIFGMYKTFHRNKDAKGIGLFITKNQIEAMNGHIEVESEVNKGTTFKLFFDRTQIK